MTDETLWFVGRGAGLIALVLLTLTTAMGIGTRSGRRLGTLPRFAVQDVHRNVSLLSIVFLGLHVGTFVADPDAEIRLVDVVLPFVAADDPLWTGLGTIALDLLLAIVITSVLRHHIGHRAWRIMHWGAYGLWPVAALHGITDGTDAGSAWFLAVWATCLLTVVAAVLWRLLPAFQERRGERLNSVHPVYEPARSGTNGLVAASSSPPSIGEFND